MVVRYGGDEFLVILADANARGGQVVVDRIADLLADWNDEEHLKNFELTFSIGVAEWAEGKVLDQMLDEADQSMYSTKKKRKVASASDPRIPTTDHSNHPSAVAKD